MRCDGRLLSSFITGALTATTVTLFLLRVVPGTYVVLPCDPTITIRPVMTEEYFDHIDTQQVVFPDDNVIDTRPLHVPGATGNAGSRRKKTPEKLRNPKKRKKLQHEHKGQAKETHAKDSIANSEENVVVSKDLRQQLKDLQEKEEKEKISKGEVPLMRMIKEPPQPKRRLQQEQQHLKEIQLHLRQEAEEKNIQEQKKHQQNTQQQRQPPKGIVHSQNKETSQVNWKNIPVRTKRKSHDAKIDIGRKVVNRKEIQDSKLLVAIISPSKRTNSRPTDDKSTKSKSVQKSLSRPFRGSSENIISGHKSTYTGDHEVTDVTRPKLSRIVPADSHNSNLMP